MIERFTFAEVNAREMRIDNWLSSPREGVTLTLGDGYEDDTAPEGRAGLATISPCAIAHARERMGRTILIHAMIDGQDVEIMCDTGLVETLVEHAFGQIDQSLLASGERALVLEHATSGIISMLERDFGVSVR
ncbi:MAG: hypothetical protein ACRCWO_08590, partial [Bosea sp. (in: a-proteobacteria)]